MWQTNLSRRMRNSRSVSLTFLTIESTEEMSSIPIYLLSNQHNNLNSCTSRHNIPISTHHFTSFIINLNFYNSMSFGIDNRKLKKLIDLYRPNNHAQEMKYLLILKGQDDLFINLQTCPFQGISLNSIEDRKTAYGINQLRYEPTSVLGYLAHTITTTSVKTSIILSVLCLILQLVGFGNGEGSLLVIILGINILNCILLSLKRFWFQRRSTKIAHQLDQKMVSVVRQNKHQRINTSQVVVGDILDIKQGDVIPADGWLIEGQNIVVSEPYINNNIEVTKNTFKQCLKELKTKLEKQPETEHDIISDCSPALIGGSLVQSGQGRMLVLCVGRLSRQGAILQKSQQIYKQNYCLAKVGKLAETIFQWLICIVIGFALIYCAKILIRSFFSSTEIVVTISSWEPLLAVAWTLIIGLPQGLQLGLVLGLWLLKGRTYYSDQIWVDYCEDLTKMANVNVICLDQSFQRGKTIYKEWWNQQNHQFYKECLDEEKMLQTEEGEQELHQDLSDEFRLFFDQISIFRSCKQPNQFYMGAEEYSSRKDLQNQQVVYTEAVNGREINYICENGMIRYVLVNFPKQDQNACLILGIGENIIDSCGSILNKTNGVLSELNQSASSQIRDITSSMNRRLMSSFAVAYFLTPRNQLEEQLDAIKSCSLTFLCLLGASGIKEHNQYQITHKLKQAGISLMLVSSSNLQETVIRARNLGVNPMQEEVLALTGEEFIGVTGDIQCSECKKSICVCSIKAGLPTVKNVQQFRHIQRSFRVLAQANSFHKYVLSVSLQNSESVVAYLGYGPEDRPALAHSYLPISVCENHLQGYAVEFPKNDIQTLSKFLLWSRFSQYFISRYLQLIIPASIVAVSILLLGSLAAQQIVVGILPFTWICTIVCPLLALGLSWQKPDQSLLKENAENYRVDSPVLSASVKKQIVGQCIWQIFLLALVMFTGHLFIPENYDSFDEIIGTNWGAKYSNQDKTYVANGLFINPLIDTPSYQSAFVGYGVHSRHLTVLFNIYALMQIFNALNCRKISDKSINIVEGIEIQTILIFLGVFALHFVFMLLAGETIGLYPYALSANQWLICIGVAITVWLTTFLLKLLPESPSPIIPKNLWVNRSVNLGIKQVVKNSILPEFDLEEEIQLKIL